MSENELTTIIPRVLGHEDAVLQGVRQILSPWENDRQTITYEGSRTAIETLASVLVKAGYEVNTDYSSPKANLRYEIGLDDWSDTNYGESWELRGNDISKKLASHEAFEGLGKLIIEADNCLNGNHPVYKATKTQTAIDVFLEKFMSPGGPPEELITYINHRMRGMSTYTETGYRIIQTIVTSSKSTLSASTSGVNRVGSPPVPSNAKFSVPSGEWLKKAPQVYDLGRGRFKITQEWVWAEKWSALAYGGTWNPGG